MCLFMFYVVLNFFPRIGLKELDDTGRLIFLEEEVDHCDSTDENFAKVVSEFLQ